VYIFSPYAQLSRGFNFQPISGIILAGVWILYCGVALLIAYVQICKRYANVVPEDLPREEILRCVKLNSWLKFLHVVPLAYLFVCMNCPQFSLLRIYQIGNLYGTNDILGSDTGEAVFGLQKLLPDVEM
jgi:hypothetical protein